MAKKKASPKESTELVLTDSEKELQALANVPDFLQELPEDISTGTDDLQDYITPSRLKIVQNQSNDLLNDFDAGQVLLMPQRMLLDVPEETPILFTPLLFFPEWCVWNDLDATIAGEPVILDRTLDRQSGIANKAKNANTREEAHPTNSKWKVNYAESLNFIGIIRNSEMLANTPVVVSFVRAEHRYGSNFASLIKMRTLPNGRPAPIYSGVYSLSVSHRKNTKGNWFGFTPGQASLAGASPWVSQNEFEGYRALHESLADNLANSKIRVDYDSDNEGKESPADTAKF